MPSPQVDGRPLPMTLFGCIYTEWIRFHDGRLPIEFHNFFANLVRVYPTGPTTIQEIITTHKSICQEAVSLLGRVERNEVNRSNGLLWRDPRVYNLNAIYHGIIIMMDQYLDPDFEPDLGELIDLYKQVQELTVLLVRTGDDVHLCAPIKFEELRSDGVCLPVARSDVPANCDDVVRVSIATAVKFVSDLHQKEVELHPPTVAIQDWKQKAQRYAEEIMKKADADGIDNVHQTWTAVRRVRTARNGEIFEPRKPYPFSGYLK